MIKTAWLVLPKSAAPVAVLLVAGVTAGCSTTDSWLGLERDDPSARFDLGEIDDASDVSKAGKGLAVSQGAVAVEPDAGSQASSRWPVRMASATAPVAERQPAATADRPQRKTKSAMHGLEVNHERARQQQLDVKRRLEKDQEQAVARRMDFNRKMAAAGRLEADQVWDRAKVAYSKLITSNPQRYEPYHRLGVIADRQKRHREAAALFAEALKINPLNATILNDLGYCYYLQGNWARARAALDRAATLSPEDPRIRNNLGMVYAKQGKEREALASFRKAGSEADARHNLAVATAEPRRTPAPATPALRLATPANVPRLNAVDRALRLSRRARHVPTMPGQPALAYRPTGAARRPTLPKETAPADAPLAERAPPRHAPPRHAAPPRGVPMPSNQLVAQRAQPTPSGSGSPRRIVLQQNGTPSAPTARPAGTPAPQKATAGTIRVATKLAGPARPVPPPRGTSSRPAAKRDAPVPPKRAEPAPPSTVVPRRTAIKQVAPQQTVAPVRRPPPTSQSQRVASKAAASTRIRPTDTTPPQATPQRALTFEEKIRALYETIPVEKTGE